MESVDARVYMYTYTHIYMSLFTDVFTRFVYIYIYTYTYGCCPTFLGPKKANVKQQILWQNFRGTIGVHDSDNKLI